MAAHDGRAAFAAPGDLDKVPGIGQKTIEEIMPYLELPRASSLPASPSSRSAS
jgi:hypothetical protein